MHDPKTSIHDLPERDRDLVRQCLAGMALGRGPLGWYSFSSVGLDWIARMLVSQGLASTTSDSHGAAYAITPLGLEFNDQLVSRYGAFTFPDSTNEDSCDMET